jgi:hypothetical protein
MSQFTEKSKPIPKNRTLKQPRCPKGEYRNLTTGICEPIAPNVNGKKQVMGCSAAYVPKDDVERARADELDKLTGQPLLDILANLQGLPLGKRYIAGTKTKQDIINLIVCLENNARELASDAESSPKNDELSSDNTSTAEPVPLLVSATAPESESVPVPVQVTEIAEEVKETDSIYADVADPARTNDQQLPNAELKMQSDMGIAPADMDTKEGNEYLQKKEFIEHLASHSDDNLDFLYPELNDPEFNVKIAKRKEFHDSMYDGKIRDIKTHANMLCDADFELMPHQMFVKNFLSFQTPYNSLLLYHGLGTGKTCSAIGIAEEARGFMKQIGVNQRILIVASPNVQNNFRLQLFDERKLEADGDLWNLNTCIGNTLLKEINPTGLRGIPRDKIISQINTIINKYYSFVGYTELAHFIQRKVLNYDPLKYSDKERKEVKSKRIRKFFDNRLIIIDEVHNIRPTDDNKEGTKIASLLKDVCKYAENIRLLLLSATPMYNSYKEIIWLTNILNAVDKRSMITESMVFDKNGDFVQGGTDDNGRVIEAGDALLRRKLTGYISYVRGENPYTFPFRIYPEIFSPEHKLDLENYPKMQMNKKEIEEPIQHIPLYVTKMGEYQEKGYNRIMDYLRNRTGDVTDKYGQTKTMPTFENMETFGYTHLEKPIQSLDIVYPSPELDNVAVAAADANIDTLVQNMVGKNGLAKIMKHKTSDVLKYDYEYNEDTLKRYGRIFNKENLQKYSNKMSDICNKIMSSSGIIIVYSQYIDGGVVPMALALEELGFSRYGSAGYTKSLFKNKPTEPLDAVTMKPKSQNAEGAAFTQARYVMITGDKRFSPNNNDDLKYITNPENSLGQNVKVVLITKAAAEGLDFKNIRQVHIMEPWYNMNRIEQIIGRGVRNRSHCGLPFEDRNVEIYLHATAPNNDEEPADMYVYRFAEKKASQIGKITRILKETSVDCILNIGQTNFTIEKLLEQAENKNIKIKLSSKPDEEIDYQVGDRAFTDMCDYMDNCSFTCSAGATIEPADVTKDTYSEDYAKINHSMIVKRIRELFKEKAAYGRTELINSINIQSTIPNKHLIRNIATTFPNENIDYKYNEIQIDFALTRFVNNKTEYLIDKYGRRGHLTNVGNVYAFQPTEITDERASIFERSVPVDYKPTALQLELRLKNTDAAPTAAQTVAEIDAITGVRTHIDVIQDLAANMQAAITMHETETGEVDWYKHLGNVTVKLKKFHSFLTDDLITKYAIHHFVDTLPMSDKLLVLRHLYNDQNATLLNIEQQIKAHLDKKIMRAGSLRGILFMLDDNEKSTFKIFVQDAVDLGGWTELPSSDYALFKSELSKYIVNVKNLNDTIGFMSPFKNNKIVFKTKKLTDKRNNKGAYCENAGKSDIIVRLNEIAGSNIYSESNIIADIQVASDITICKKEKKADAKKNADTKVPSILCKDEYVDVMLNAGAKLPNIIFKNGLCVMMEILLRYYDEKKHRSQRWFFNPEEAILNRIAEIKK